MPVINLLVQLEAVRGDVQTVQADSALQSI